MEITLNSFESDYFVKLIGNFEKLLEDRRCKARQEMMKCRIEMETEFKFNMKNAAFHSLMTLRSKVYESTRKIKNINKEIDRRIEKMDTKESTKPDTLQNAEKNAEIMAIKSFKTKGKELNDQHMTSNQVYKTRNDEANLFMQEQKDSKLNFFAFNSCEMSNEPEVFEQFEVMDEAIVMKTKNEINEDQKNEKMQNSLLDPKFLEKSLDNKVIDWPLKSNYSTESNESTSLSESSFNDVYLNMKKSDEIDSICDIFGATSPPDNDKNVGNEEETEKISIEDRTGGCSFATMGPENEKQSKHQISLNDKTTENKTVIDVAANGIRAIAETRMAFNPEENEGKMDESSSCNTSIFNLKAEDSLSGTEIKFPISEEEMQAMKRIDLDEQSFEKSRVVDTGCNSKAKKGSNASDNLRYLECENNCHDSLHLPNVIDIAYSPRNPSKYYKFKIEREKRKHPNKINDLRQSESKQSVIEDSLANSLKILPQSADDSDDLWLVTPLENPWSPFTYMNNSGNDDELRFSYDTNTSKTDENIKGILFDESMNNNEEGREKSEMREGQKLKQKSRIPVKKTSKRI